MKRAHRWAAAVVLGAAGMGMSHVTTAQTPDADKAQARELVTEGLAELRSSDFTGALKSFNAADKLFHAPTTLLGVARANAGLKKYVAALEAYNKLVREPLAPNAPDAFVNAVDDAKKELDALVPKVPTILIEVAGPKEPQVTIDGANVPSASLGFKRPIDPGKHVITASAPGFLPGKIEVTAVEGATAPVAAKLTLVPGGPPVVASASASPASSAAPLATGAPASTGDAPPSAPSQQKTYAYVAWGVGGAGLALGVIGGVLALGKKSDLKTACPNNQCPDSAKPTHDSFKTDGLLSTVGFVVAIVGGGAGTALYFTAPKPASSGLTLAPNFGLGSVGLNGSF